MNDSSRNPIDEDEGLVQVNNCLNSISELCSQLLDRLTELFTVLEK